jgi:multidrug transporter EmrE-like cation transporter
MRPADLVWLLMGVALNAGAQLGLKAATRATGSIDGSMSSLWTASGQLATSPPFWAALIAYGLSLGVWVVGLSRVPVSQAYPVLSVGYILTALLAWMLLGESIGTQRWLGIAVIIAGVWLVTRSP